MKISKRVLKQIVKECLVELLTEGLGAGASSAFVSLADDRPVSNVLMNSARVSEGHSRLPPPAPKREMTKAGNGMVANAVRELAAANPMMASIFADTAKNTLMEQGISNESPPASTIDPRADRAAKIADIVPPEQLFGEEAASKWATLAFMPANKKL